MPKNEKHFFIACCLLFVTVQYFMSFSIGYVIGLSLIAIPALSLFGVLLCDVGLFFYKKVNPNDSVHLGLWAKSGFGLLVGSILKPLFGIGF